MMMAHTMSAPTHIDVVVDAFPEDEYHYSEAFCGGRGVSMPGLVSPSDGQMSSHAMFPVGSWWDGAGWSFVVRRFDPELFFGVDPSGCSSPRMLG